MMKQTELKLIQALRKDSRETLTSISRKLKIPISTLYDTLKRNSGGLITKNTTIIDFAKLGFNCRASVMLKVGKESREKLAGYLKASGPVNNLFRINNGFDFLLEGIFLTVKDMEDFMQDLESKFQLEDMKFFHLIDDLKREEFMAA